MTPVRPVCPQGGAEEPSPLFKRLFFQTTGFIDVNACQRNQVAACHANQVEGSVFTSAFTSALGRHHGNGDSSFGWRELMSDVRRMTEARFQAEYGQQEVDLPDGTSVTQRTQIPDVISMDIRQHAWRVASSSTLGRRSDSNSVSRPPVVTGSRVTSTRLGVDVAARQGELRVTQVYRGGPATRLNYGTRRGWKLENNDRIVSINGKDVHGINDFASAVRESDSDMHFTVAHGQTGKFYSFTTRLNRLGTQLNGSSSSQKLRFGVWFSKQYRGRGVQIHTVKSNSPATRVKHENGQEWYLERGDVVTAINGQPVSHWQQAVNAVRDSPSEMSVDVIGRRTGRSHTFTVQLWDVN